MQAAMQQRRITSRGLVQQYLDRIEKYEDRLNAIITLNPRALDEADARDRERAAGKVRGPLHGIPIALKDNIHTTGLPTTGGALAFKGFVPPYDATVTKNVRDAGAIVIAKTNMTELANWIATGMPGNYSAVAGYGFNPYDARRDPREATGDGRPALSPGGSSSGAGTARTSGQRMSAPRRRARSSRRPIRPCSSASSRRLAASAVTALFRLRPIRIPRARWRKPSRTQRSYSECSKAQRPILTIR